MIKKLIKSTLFASLIFLAACSPKSEYTHAIPKNASVVVSMELDEMAQKAGLEGESGESVSRKLKTLMKGGLQGDAAQLAERIIDNPSESGISFNDKVYLFATPHVGAWGLLLKVDNEGKLESLFEVLEKEALATPLREESGCRWTQIGGVLCAFNNGTLLFLQPSKGDAQSMKGTLLSLMRQQEEDGFSALPEFDKVEAEGNDIASVFNLSAVPYEWTTPLRMGLSGDIHLEDIKYFVSGNFKNGRVVVETESLIQNPKIAAFFDTMDKVLQPIQGKYLDYYQGNTMVWASGRIQGQELYKMLCQNPTVKQVLNNPLLPVDVEGIFSSVEGDFAIGQDNMVTGGNILLYADVTNTDFLKTFEDIRPLLALTGGRITLDCVGQHEYLMRTYYGDFWFGVKNNRLYATNNRTWAEEVGRTYGGSLSMKPWAREVRENRLFFTLNMSDLFASLGKYPNVQWFGSKQMDGMAKLLLSQCDYLALSMSDCRHGKGELALKDKNLNLLQVLAQMIESF